MSPGFLFVQLDRSGDFTGTHTPGTNIHMAGGTVDDCLHALDVGLPCAIGAAVRVRHSNTESNALIAELALCHPLHLLAVAYFCAFRRHFDIIAESFSKCKDYFQKNSTFLKVFFGRFFGLFFAPEGRGKVLRNPANSYII